MTKRQNEQVFQQLTADVFSCHRNTTTMRTLHRPDNTQENRFYNACLQAMIKDRETELNFKGNNGECYI